MKKISLVYLLMIVILFGCGDDSSEDINESSSIVEQVVPFAGTRQKEIKRGVSNGYSIEEAEFYSIRDMDFDDNYIILIDTDDKRDLVRLININSQALQTLSESDIQQSSVFDEYSTSQYLTINFVRLDADKERIYLGNYRNIYSMKLFTGKPLIFREDAGYAMIDSKGDLYYYAEDYDHYDNHDFIWKDMGSTAEKLFEAPLNTFYPNFVFFITDNGDLILKEPTGRSNLYKKSGLDTPSDLLFSPDEAIDKIIMTSNENFIFSSDSDLYFLQNGENEAIHLNGPGSILENIFEDISALSLDDEHKILFVANDGMIHAVKLNRL